MSDAPRRKGGLLRFFVRLIGFVLLLAIIALGVIYWQAKQITDNLQSEAPLAIKQAKPTPQEKKALQQKVKTSVQLTQTIKLTGPEITVALQETLADKGTQSRLIEARARLIEALLKIEDPTGIVSGIRLDKLDLQQLVAEITVKDGQATLRATAPYTTGGYLNLRSRFTGRYQKPNSTLTLHSVYVGKLDLLAITGVGDRLRELATEALLKQVDTHPLREIRQMSLADHQVIINVGTSKKTTK